MKVASVCMGVGLLAWVGMGLEYEDNAHRVGVIQNLKITESSGLAVSRRSPGVLWTHNDSGGDPRLYAMDEKGRDLGVWEVDVKKNKDWEDLASFTLDGKAYLLVADVGDNDRDRGKYKLIVVEEPAVGGATDEERKGKAKPEELKEAWEVEFRYPDRSHDCEAVGVDVTSGKVFLVTKVVGTKCEVYEVPLKSEKNKTVTAKKVGDIPGNLVTAMDISADGRRMIVMTYGPAYFYERGESEDWSAALKREGRVVQMPVRRQGEAICFDAKGESLYLTSEGKAQPIWRLDVKQPAVKTGGAAAQ